MKKSVWYVFLATALVLILSGFGWSQGTTSLSGTVTDKSGAVIPGVEVTATNLATNATRSNLTNETGTYLFPQMPPGTYKVEFKMQGFSTVVRDNTVLPIGTPQVISISLEVGAMTENVLVEGGAVPVNTIDASEGSPFSELQVKQLPLEARNPSQLLSLQAGVIWAGEGLSDQRQGSVFGSRPNQGNITLDGADVNDQVNQTAMQSVLPIPLDSVQEFRVTTTNGGAQYGRSSGAQVELVTKSGGNTWHGSAYEFNRNEKFASNGFFENRLGIPKAPLKRNIFGASVGGPLKKDRVFFFGNWESRRDSTATPQTRVVPSDSLRDGVLLYPCATPSECPGGTVQGLTGSYQVRSGWNGLTPAQVAQIIDPCGSTTCIDALGKAITPGPNAALIALMKGYPHGNDPTLGSILGIDNGFNSTGYRFAAPIKVNNNDYVARLDFTQPPASFVNYATYLGGVSGDVAYDVTSDSAGNIYVTGYTLSSDFPISSNALVKSWGGGTDAFVTKLNANGSLAYSSYVGSAGQHVGSATAVTNDGTIYVGGVTSIQDIFVTDNAFQGGYGGGVSDGFLIVVAL